MFKISKSDVPKPLHALFRINNSYHNYQTRRSESIHVPIGRTEAIYKTFSYFGAHIWNHISNKVSANVSYSSFNPIRSGLFQTANDPGGGGFKSPPPPPTISKTIVSILTIPYMCILPGVLGMFQLEFFLNSQF